MITNFQTKDEPGITVIRISLPIKGVFFRLFSYATHHQ